MGFNIAFILIAVLNVAACSVLGIVFAWKLGLVIVLIGLPIVVGCGWLKMLFDGRMERDISSKLSASSAIASESVTAIRTVSSLSIEGSILDRYTAELDFAISHARRPLLGAMVWFALTQSTEYLLLALGFWLVHSNSSLFIHTGRSLHIIRYGTRLVASGEITLFSFFVSFMSVFFSAQATAQIFQFSTSKLAGRPLLWSNQVSGVSFDNTYRYNERKEWSKLFVLVEEAPAHGTENARKPRHWSKVNWSDRIEGSPLLLSNAVRDLYSQGSKPESSERTIRRSRWCFRLW
jgi:ABC-type bacteriocin/lantibiotic exporter with double-glycine peptidase domain